jgi:hypothetical protein
LALDSVRERIECIRGMNRKGTRIDALIAPFQGRGLDPHYLGFFDCFNQQHFYEAHEVLERLWLAERHGPNGPFYKGLIQLAGAFVHLQKGRAGPALALFKLARTNLRAFPRVHLGMEMHDVLALIETWTTKLTCSPSPTDLLSAGAVAALRPILPQGGDGG